MLNRYNKCCASTFSNLYIDMCFSEMYYNVNYKDIKNNDNNLKSAVKYELRTEVTKDLMIVIDKINNTPTKLSKTWNNCKIDNF